ncbi:MAG: hypothetical protein AB7T49_18150 [Oligoflexales bacterium]
MISIRVAIIAVLALGFVSCGRAPKKHHHQKTSVPLTEVANEEPANFRGYLEVSEILKERVMNKEFDLGSYVGESAYTNYDKVLDLLGGYKSTGLEEEFRNGTANPLNMLLWFKLLSAVADDVGQICEPTEEATAKLKFEDEFAANVAKLCVKQGEGAVGLDDINPVLDQILASDVPEEERLAISEFLVEGLDADQVPSEFVSDVVLAASFNPYFLIQQ